MRNVLYADRPIFWKNSISIHRTSLCSLEYSRVGSPVSFFKSLSCQSYQRLSVIQYQHTVVMWRLTGSLKHQIRSDLSSSWLVTRWKFHLFTRARSRARWEIRVCLSTGEPPLCDCSEGLRLFTLLKPDNRKITWVLWTYFVVQASILRPASLSEGQRLI